MEYDLERSEGLLLRHLNGVYKVLSQTVPDATKTDDVLEIEWYFKSMVRGVDASLADEWERMRTEVQSTGVQSTEVQSTGVQSTYDLTADRRAFTAAIRARIFQVLKAWSRGDAAAMMAALDLPDRADPPVEPWTPLRVKATVDAYLTEHGAVRFDPEARNPRHTHIDIVPGGSCWRMTQMLIDPEMLNDWAAEFEVDVEASRTHERPVLLLLRIAPLT
jgi:hypothetical protein